MNNLETQISDLDSRQRSIDFVYQILDLETFNSKELQTLSNYYKIPLDNPNFFKELARAINSSLVTYQGNLSQDIKKQIIRSINDNNYKEFSRLLDFIPENKAKDTSIIKKMVDKDLIDFFKTYIEKFHIDINLLDYKDPEDPENKLTIFQYSLMSGSPNIISYLLTRNDLDLTIKDTTGDDSFAAALILSSINRSESERKKRLELTKKIISKIKNPNIHQSDGDTYLIMAVLTGDTDIVKIILEKKPKINDTADNGSTALMFACQELKISSSIVELLIKNKSNVNIQNNLKMTALMYCLQQISEKKETNENQFEKINLLLDNKANVNLSDHDGESVIHYLSNEITFNEYSIKILKLILEYSPSLVNDVSNEYVTPLMDSCNTRYYNKYTYEFIELLLENGANPNKKDSTGDNVLWYINKDMEHKDYKKIVELLLDYNLNINSKNNDGRNILFGNFNYDKIRFLISHKADINVIDNEGNGILKIHFDNDELRLYLINLGAPPNGLDSNDLKIYYSIKMKNLEGELDRYILLLTPYERELVSKQCFDRFKKRDKEHYEEMDKCLRIIKDIVKLRPESKKVKQLEEKYKYNPLVGKISKI